MKLSVVPMVFQIISKKDDFVPQLLMLLLVLLLVTDEGLPNHIKRLYHCIELLPYVFQHNLHLRLNLNLSLNLYFKI
jgi:hypothetical protein